MVSPGAASGSRMPSSRPTAMCLLPRSTAWPRHTLPSAAGREINEAFGAQAMACARSLGLDESKLNVNGGAIAIGHPLGATGVRLALTLARELRRCGERYGVASACIGGGQGVALLIENP